MPILGTLARCLRLRHTGPCPPPLSPAAMFLRSGQQAFLLWTAIFAIELPWKQVGAQGAGPTA